MDCSTPGFPVLHCLLEFAQNHIHWVGNAIYPSHLLLPCPPFAFNLPQHSVLSVIGSLEPGRITILWPFYWRIPRIFFYSSEFVWATVEAFFQSTFPKLPFCARHWTKGWKYLMIHDYSTAPVPRTHQLVQGVGVIARPQDSYLLMFITLYNLLPLNAGRLSCF